MLHFRIAEVLRGLRRPYAMLAVIVGYSVFLATFLLTWYEQFKYEQQDIFIFVLSVVCAEILTFGPFSWP